MFNLAATTSSIIDQLSEGIILVSEGRVDGLNAAAAAMLGADLERSAGLPLIAVLRDHRLERLWLKGGEAELRLRGRDVVARAVQDGLILQDVTETRVAKTEARELLAVLSHELRTPVTAVRSTLEALGYEDLPQATKTQFLQRAGEEIERLVRLLDDLTVDVVPPRVRQVEFAWLLGRAEALLKETLETRAVRITPVGGPVTLHADPDKLLQILINLVENAAIHGPSNAVVEVRAEPTTGGTNVTVRDEGDPIDPASVDALFRPHRQGQSPRGRGTGMGLYIVKSIAERAGGRAWSQVWIDNDNGRRGNEFGVFIPSREEFEGNGAAQSAS